jgi:DNA-binding NarL/FixJ family response regulator
MSRLPRPTRGAPGPGSLSRLSDGERAVAGLIGRGKTNGEIGQELSTSVATVKAYVSRSLTSWS